MYVERTYELYALLVLAAVHGLR